MDPHVTQPADAPSAGLLPGASVQEALRRVPWLAELGGEALAHVAGEATPVRFDSGKILMAELEGGENLYILLSGEAAVEVTSIGGSRRQIGTLGPGDACGEIAVLTRSLRSATVTARQPVRALRLERGDFEHLLACYPTIAVHFARLLSRRLSESDASLDALVASASHGTTPAGESTQPLDDDATPADAAQPTLARAWRELMVSHRRELPFLTLASFLGVLLTVRVLIAALGLGGNALFVALRTLYTGGIAMVFLSTAAALLRFRITVQRALAVVFGAGFALILNCLSVFLAFDIFYLDMTTRDPKMVFRVEDLYHRTDSEIAIALMVALLVTLTYLRHFLHRAAFVLFARVRKPRNR